MFQMLKIIKLFSEKNKKLTKIDLILFIFFLLPSEVLQFSRRFQDECSY